MSQVFISYDRADGTFTTRLIEKLQGAGIPVWKDSQSLQAGEDWRAKIDEAIKQSFALIVVMTPEARESEYVSYEWACGLGAGVKVIPVLLKPTELHARLSAIHYLDFTNPEQQPWIALIDELRRAADAYQPTSIRLPANAPALVHKAVEALDSFDVDEQSRAIRALTQIDHPSAREALAGAVHHPTRDVRIKAALELCRFKDPRAVPGLIESQRHWQLRWEFVRLISALGSAAVAELVEALHSEDDQELREYAAHALGEIKDSSAIPSLTIALQDTVTSVRDAAARALEKIKAGQ